MKLFRILFCFLLLAGAMAASPFSMLSAEDPELLTDAQKLQRAAAPLLEDLPEEPIRKLEAIHDRLLACLSYREGPAQPGDNTEAALINGYGVCDGYSRSFQYLCSQAGIPCRVIKGSSIRRIPHSWNMVFLDGEWLYVDTTWDESSNERPYHDYFLVSLKEMQRDHFPDGTPFLPDGSGPGYYEQLGYTVKADSPSLKEDFAKAFAKQFQDFPPEKPGPVFLEVKLLGEPYLESRKAFQQNIYPILGDIHKILKNTDTLYTIQTYGAIEYHFNDATHVLTLYPVAVK